ncbi:hypothetical protein HGRIS_011713 [Hohenbuehelia grisea]|uniref:Major facilitator superfamily (MFS) profile domain-containing protein n=1 Tax=Hohenbuehelia grisea TaxID=104357 RepID=A0ABR3JVY5_9AGAR
MSTEDSNARPHTAATLAVPDAPEATRPNTTASAASSDTHVPTGRPTFHLPHHNTEHEGRGESALPEDKKEEALENAEEDWEDDPINPRNWSFGKKWTAVAVVSMYTFVSPLASSMMAPGLPEVALKYGVTDSTILALTLSIFLVSFALGPLVLAPLSEIHGRTWVLHINNLFSIAFNIGCAFSPTVGSLIGFRFLAGLSGSAPIACGAGSIGDLFSERDRASAMAVYSLGPLVGPVVGPVAGGFVAQTIGIKYVFIIIAACSGIAAVIGIPLLRETYAPVIRMRLAKASADPEAAAKLHPAVNAAHQNAWHVLWVNISRPMILLTHSFICFILSLYMALWAPFRLLIRDILLNVVCVAACMASTILCSQPSPRSSPACTVSNQVSVASSTSAWVSGSSSRQSLVRRLQTRSIRNWRRRTGEKASLKCGSPHCFSGPSLFQLDYSGMDGPLKHKYIGSCLLLAQVFSVSG